MHAIKPKVHVTELFVAGTAAVPKEGTTDNSQTETLDKRVSSIKKVYLDINIDHDRMCHINEKDLRATMYKYGIKLTGNRNPCPACLIDKAKIKTIPKMSLTQATRPGERIFMDTSGPFTTTLSGNFYWNKICDQYSKFSWDQFLKAKSEVPERMEEFFEMAI